MITSQTSFLFEILSGQPIPIRQLAYFRARLSNKIHALVISEFMRLERENKINRAELARRIGRKPEQVTRWLGAPGNWTIETFSDLLLGMGYEPRLSLSPLDDKQAMRDQVFAHVPTGHLDIEGRSATAMASGTLASQGGKTNALAAANPGTSPFQYEKYYAPERQSLGGALAQSFESPIATHAREARL